MPELGETGDPRALVPGDPAAVHESARSMTTYAGDLREAGDALRTLSSVDGWSGTAADQFRSRFELQPPKWLDGADCFAATSRALDVYAETLTWAQREAAEAIRLWDEGQAATTSAAATYDEQARQPSPPGAAPLPPFVDPGQARRQAAIDALARARQQLDAAGNAAADAVGAARDQAPERTTFWGEVGDTLGDVGQGALDVGKDVVDGVASVGNAAPHNPGDVAAMLGGAGLMGLGAGGEIGGVALDLTGVGAAAGVPLNVASAGLIVTGAGVGGPEPCTWRRAQPARTRSRHSRPAARLRHPLPHRSRPPSVHLSRTRSWATS